MRETFIQYQGEVQPVYADTVTESRWHQPWSEPTRRKGIKVCEIQYLAFNPQPVVSIPWFEGLSEPKRLKKGTKVQDQPFFSFQPTPIINISWFDWFSDPKRKKIGLLPTVQPYFQFSPNPFVSFSWFDNLSDPVRIPKRLIESLQQTTAFNPPKPIEYGIILDATETKDYFSGILWNYNRVVSAYVDIRELTPGRGYVGLVEDDHVSASIAVAEPEAVGTGGAPIIPVAAARVGIREI